MKNFDGWGLLGALFILLTFGLFTKESPYAGEFCLTTVVVYGFRAVIDAIKTTR